MSLFKIQTDIFDFNGELIDSEVYEVDASNSQSAILLARSRAKMLMREMAECGEYDGWRISAHFEVIDEEKGAI